jgi:ABC-type amino acid transport substrate-binding protein
LRATFAGGVRRGDDGLVDAVNQMLNRLIDDGTLARIDACCGVAYRRR